MTRPRAQALAALLALALPACLSSVRYVDVGLQRNVLPGLEKLDEEGIADFLDRELDLEFPVSAGLVWLSDGPPRAGAPEQGPPLTEFQRTAVIQEAVGDLANYPFEVVAPIPTTPATGLEAGSQDLLRAVRSAAAQFQYEMVILLRTATHEPIALNPFALGFIGIVTIPLFPGEDLAVNASAEMCGVAVRTGIVIACASGRFAKQQRYVFPMSADRVKTELREVAVREAVLEAIFHFIGAMRERS